MHVQIDYEAWIPLNDVAQNTGLHFREVLGIMAALWQSTQSRKLWKIKKSKFARYAKTMDLDQERNDSIIDELIHEHLLEEDGEDLIIVGNKKHIDAVEGARKKRTDRAKKAANARWGKEDATSIPQASDKDDCSSDGHATVHSSTGQYIAEHTVHSSADQGKQAPRAADNDLDDSNFFDPDDLADPEKVIELWNELIVPVASVPRASPGVKSNTYKSLMASILKYPRLSDWKQYFSLIALSDWHVNRRETFSFHAVTYAENVAKEVGRYRQKSLQEMQGES